MFVRVEDFEMDRRNGWTAQRSVALRRLVYRLCRLLLGTPTVSSQMLVVCSTVLRDSTSAEGSAVKVELWSSMEELRSTPDRRSSRIFSHLTARLFAEFSVAMRRSWKDSFLRTNTSLGMFVRRLC